MTLARRVARLRRRVATSVWRVALGPTGGAVPRAFVRSIAGREGLFVDEKRIESIELIAPAHLESYDFDASVPAKFRRSKAFDDRYLYRLREICVSPATGLCWLPGGPIIGESVTGSVARLLGWGAAALEDPLLMPRTTIEGPVVVLPRETYAHWLLEDLPAALHALERVPEATVVVPAGAPRYLEESLELLGITNVHRSSEPIRAEEIVLTARDPSYSFVPREDVALLREAFLGRVGRGDDAAIYVSRRLDDRHPANEHALERALEREGVRVVLTQELSFRQQIELFAGARTIAGAHGAGIANVAWSAADDVIEVFTSRHVKDMLSRVAVSLGVGYRPFFCSKTPDRHGAAPVEEFVEAVREAMTNPAGGVTGGSARSTVGVRPET